jgi:hypothetical protein
MRIVVEIIVESDERPAAGSSVHVELRDTSYEDVAATTVAAADGFVRGGWGAALETVDLLIDQLPFTSTIFVHVDVDGDGRVSPGDYITMTSYPAPAVDGGTATVAVRKV